MESMPSPFPFQFQSDTSGTDVVVMDEEESGNGTEVRVLRESTTKKSTLNGSSFQILGQESS